MGVSSTAASGDPYDHYPCPNHAACCPHIAGILILLMPQLLNYIVAIYLILAGIPGFTQAGTRSDLLTGASSNPIEAVLPVIAQHQQPPRMGPFDDFRR